LPAPGYFRSGDAAECKGRELMVSHQDGIGVVGRE